MPELTMLALRGLGGSLGQPRRRDWLWTESSVLATKKQNNRAGVFVWEYARRE
ncbi:MAG TPA: hypothetical protein PLX18_09735 [Anaerohalosphaeraceae bacterium]|nr:hypothetical protein [Anaerohalosphaeraceae bacterium]HQG06608.1 hypothetical protein [Anaerohalosphaeraceae bacterium]HQI08119.1 hypothetical protein [Anaerohalosphaeraceae bacterium]HQJ68467.1 hypothetical protein [Anaerohalosphaeraceae bacterium]